MAPQHTTDSAKAEERGATMATFQVIVPFAADAAEATERVRKHLPDGFRPTGGTEFLAKCRVSVEVAGDGDVDAAWVNLTSYGMSPEPALGSVWQAAGL